MMEYVQPGQARDKDDDKNSIEERGEKIEMNRARGSAAAATVGEREVPRQGQLGSTAAVIIRKNRC
jgi:hypothetical protein